MDDREWQEKYAKLERAREDLFQVLLENAERQHRAQIAVKEAEREIGLQDDSEDTTS